MGGYFGAVNREDAITDAFFGTDYHSHLGTKRAGMAAYDATLGLQREIHNIENTPFRTRFEHIFQEMRGNASIGCISDGDPQPLLIRSGLGRYAICVIGRVNNLEALVEQCFASGNAHFNGMTGGVVNTTELVATLINQKKTFVEGIQYAQNVIDGSATILLLLEGGEIIAARDKLGRLPVLVGKREDGYCVAFESFAYKKLDYEDERELGPGEIVKLTVDGVEQLAPPGDKMKICSFLWSYYGYPTSTYEGQNVEVMRYRNGAIMARRDVALKKAEDADSVSGVPDSGTPHAIGYANERRLPFARPYIKYTPTWSRSFMPGNQQKRTKIAKMKQIPIHDLIEGKKLLIVDDSIVRGTQLKETVDFLYQNGAKSVHMRSASPPIMYNCKYLGFSPAKNEMELLARKTIMQLEGEAGFEHINEYSDASTERGKRLREAICEQMHFDSLDFQSLDGVIEAIGLDPCKLCTYCWNGKE